MVYEAMLAGLEMTEFPVFKKNVMNPGKGSMTLLNTVWEYAYPLIKWEVHSVDRPPLLDDEGKVPLRLFTRAWHRKRPRQIYDHQKLHLLVMHNQELFPEKPFAGLPDSWFGDSGRQYGRIFVQQRCRFNVIPLGIRVNLFANGAGYTRTLLDACEILLET
ncbi:hypothetical protein EI94DRAFT_1011657 [Lactarius quietus]|nr:hypothetical protein EI94DRAFT_1011657 [Lactarius quietus]